MDLSIICSAFEKTWVQFEMSLVRFGYYVKQLVSFTNLEMNAVLQLSHICPPNSLLILQCMHRNFISI